jgi:hypothetical protein
MYDDEVRAAARAAMHSGDSLNSISKRLDISRAALREWRDNPERRAFPANCPRCHTGYTLDVKAYSHLLGLYLATAVSRRTRRTSTHCGSPATTSTSD